MSSQRLRLRRPDFSHADNPYIDGGWWPESADLGPELAGLVADGDPAGFRVRRVLYNLDDAGRERLELFVVPSDTDAAIAERAMSIAARDGDATRAGDILDAAAVG